MKLWGAVLYCAVLTILTGVWFVRQLKTEEVTTAALPANRLIQQADVRRVAKNGEIEGRYLRVAVPKGSAIAPTDTTSLPELMHKKGSVQMLLPAARDTVTSGAVNTAIAVHLCDGAKALSDPSAAPMTVQAILCGVNPGACSAVVEMQPDKVGALATAAAAATSPLLRPANAKCE